ncbi:unnamed protein product, partial [Tetraodon nigroviridis]
QTLWQYQFRIIMLGDSTVWQVFFSEALLPKTCSWTPSARLSVTRSYYRNSAGGMLMFDMTNRTSFEHVKEWHREVSAKTGQNVTSAFELIARCIYKGLQSGEVELQEGWDGVKS